MDAMQLLKIAEREARERLNRRRPESVAVSTLPPALQHAVRHLPKYRRLAAAAERTIRRAGYHAHSIRRGRLRLAADHVSHARPRLQLAAAYRRAQLALMKAENPRQRALAVEQFDRDIKRITR